MSQFTYEFKFADGSVNRFEIDLEQERGRTRRTEERPPWTELEFHQCANCPLNVEEHPHCPVAIDVEEVAEKFRDALSFERADVWVRTKDRDYYKNCDVQSGLKSLMGLIMGASDCPILTQMKPMAHYHLPFSSVQETVYRVAGAYLLKQYFLRLAGVEPDMDLAGLERLYSDLQVVNRGLIQRIRAASAKDANLNALNILFSLSSVVAMTLDEKLEELKPLFVRDREGDGEAKMPE